MKNGRKNAIWLALAGIVAYAALAKAEEAPPPVPPPGVSVDNLEVGYVKR